MQIGEIIQKSDLEDKEVYQESSSTLLPYRITGVPLQAKETASSVLPLSNRPYHWMLTNSI